MTDLWENPIGTDGFEFVEYTAPDVKQLHDFFEQMGFRAVGRHRSKDVTLYRQGETSFIVNAEPESHGARFARAHGPSRLCDGVPREGRGLRVSQAASSLVPSRSTTRSGRWSSISPPSRASAAASSIWSTATANIRSTTSISCPPIRRRDSRMKAPASPTSTTSPTTSSAATWTSGPASTRSSSTSGKSATSTSRAS